MTKAVWIKVKCGKTLLSFIRTHDYSLLNSFLIKTATTTSTASTAQIHICPPIHPYESFIIKLLSLRCDRPYYYYYLYLFRIELLFEHFNKGTILAPSVACINKKL
jgi:hypothetical protein